MDKCTGCKQLTHTGIDGETGKCWTCRFPRDNELALTDVQREMIKIAQES